MTSSPAAPGQSIGGRYRLVRALSESPDQGVLWLASDGLAADASVALRQLPAVRDPAMVRSLASRLQGVLHPQVPRFGAVIEEGGRQWLVRDWQAGRTYDQLLEARRERQLVFGAGEVLLLLRQLLPVLVALHGQDLLHGDISAANLLRRDSDGLPVLLDFGLVRGAAAAPRAAPPGATPGYAPPELIRGEPPAPWMDLHALGVLSLVLVSGEEPAALLDPLTLEWRMPVALEAEPALRQLIERLLSRDPSRRFTTAAEALAALQVVPMPESTGPVPRADRTVVLVPQAPEPLPVAPVAPSDWAVGNPQARSAGPAEAAALQDVRPASVPGPELPGLATAAPAPEPAFRAPVPRPRPEEKEEAAEGGLWPVLIALVLSAVVGTALGWLWLGRGRPTAPAETVGEVPLSLPPAEVDQRQQLLNRLRALQIDRGWFLSLADASLLAQYPERKGRLPGDALEDAPLRKVWNDLAQEWLARVEQLPLPLRRRLGSFRASDWEQRQQSLVAQGLSSSVLAQLVSGSASSLLPGQSGDRMPPEPYRQLWYAAAELTLDAMRIDPIELRSQVTEVLAADVPANGARLFAVRLPVDHSLALGVNGTPLLQMAVYAADGSVLSPRGALRVVSLGNQKASPVQLLVTNEGVSPARISLSLRADPPAPPAPSPTPSSPAEIPPVPAPPDRLLPTEPSEPPGASSAPPTPPEPTTEPGSPPAGTNATPSGAATAPTQPPNP
ncbi:serine/threonine protein kinase [Vulcanococcus limneticus]|uniref:serine/threonine protein kinase n=1 Tax=Vulcanococcus limneticus TaxID=2170428 RepID=UPI00398BE2D5